MKSFLIPQIVILLFANSQVFGRAFLLQRNHISIHFRPKITPSPRRQDMLKNRINSKFPLRGGAVRKRGNLGMVSTNLVLFDNVPLSESTKIFVASNLVGFIISLATGSHLHLDLIGTGAFSLSTLPTLISTNLTRVKLSSMAVFLWGSKLAGFLFFRALKVKHDTRLDETLSTVSGMGGFWFVSLLWGLICSLPHTLGTTSTAQGNPLLIKTGVIMYSLGLITESLSDYQKWMFKVENPTKFCNVGLWSVSQHPNFFGNLLLWTGIFVMNASSLVELPNDDGGGMLTMVSKFGRVFIALLSPLFMWTLFSSQANGTFSNTVELANKKYGNDPNYKDYITTVPLIIPGLVAWLRQLLPW